MTASASNAFPSSSNSSILSESAPSRRDKPCRSPDCSPEEDRRRGSLTYATGSGRCVRSPASLAAVAVLFMLDFLGAPLALNPDFFGADFFGAAFFAGLAFFARTDFDFFDFGFDANVFLD